MKKAAGDSPEATSVEGFVARVRRNPIVATLIVVSTLVAAIASFTDAANKLLAPFRSQSPSAARAQLGQLNLPFTAEAFVTSAASGDATATRLFLAAGMEPNTVTERQGSALGNAAASGKAEVVKLLLAAGAKLTADENRPSALGSAAAGRHPDIVLLLLDGKPAPTADEIDEAFMMAGRRDIYPQERDYAAMKLLAGRGARVAKVAPDMFQRIFERALGDDDAADITRALLDLGADPNGTAGRDGKVVTKPTPLMGAAADDYVKTAALLLERGARIDVRYDRPEPDDRGWTAMQIAVREQRAAVARLLIDQGADVEETNSSGDNALLLASRHGDMETMKAVLSKATRLDQPASDGRTALMLLVEGFRSYGQDPEVTFDAVRELLKRGARVDLKDRTGQTALMVAAETSAPATVKLLLASGARTTDRDAKGRRPIDYTHDIDDPVRKAAIVKLLR